MEALIPNTRNHTAVEDHKIREIMIALMLNKQKEHVCRFCTLVFNHTSFNNQPIKVKSQNKPNIYVYIREGEEF